MRETIKGIMGGIGCIAGWAIVLWLAYAWLQDGKRQSEARAEAERIEQQYQQQIREANQWREQQETIRYQFKLQRQENDRILEEQERMLLRVQPIRPIEPLRY